MGNDMTQENKELLLKDLCARLPYGVIAETPQGKAHVCDINLTIFGTEVGVNINATSRDKFNIEDIKPYLFPLSSMTDEQNKELDQAIELELKAISGEIDHTQSTAFEVDFYNKHHFDWRGLIPLGLAKDATGLNIY